ncbi:MAG: translation initiation factor IF-2 subunit beta [Candidatus Diapherotrites archaeon]|nr:translation initiation factor IF-2 subunit beta [Candidatus Diapherotrites archaeon]
MDPYGKLLDRMYANLPKRDAGTERFEFPRVESFIQGPKTYVKNFLQLLKIMRREDPRDILKFLTKESASPAQVEGDRLVFSGKFGEKQINGWFKRFLDEFVLCKVCGKPDTHYVEHNGVRQLKCEACGAISPIRRG